MKRRALILALSAACLMSSAFAQTTAPLKIGVFSGAAAALVEVAAQEARKQGLDVRLTEFSDWTTPNAAVDAGDLDANYFQHQAFLDDAIRARGYKLKSVDIGILTNIGLFSNKFKRLEEIKEGQRIGIYSDPSNQTRSLRFLESAGLIKLKAARNANEKITVADITDNPKKLKFIEIDGPQLVRSFEDVDLATIYAHTLVVAGKADLANRGLAYSKEDDLYYAARFVTRENNTNDPRLKRFVKVFHESPVVRQAIHEAYAKNDRLYSLPWLKGKVQ